MASGPAFTLPKAPNIRRPCLTAQAQAQTASLTPVSEEVTNSVVASSPAEGLHVPEDWEDDV